MSDSKSPWCTLVQLVVQHVLEVWPEVHAGFELNQHCVDLRGIVQVLIFIQVIDELEDAPPCFVSC